MWALHFGQGWELSLSISFAINLPNLLWKAVKGLGTILDIWLCTLTNLINVTNRLRSTKQSHEDIIWVNQARFTYLKVQHVVRAGRVFSCLFFLTERSVSTWGSLKRATPQIYSWGGKPEEMRLSSGLSKLSCSFKQSYMQCATAVQDNCTLAWCTSSVTR